MHPARFAASFALAFVLLLGGSLRTAVAQLAVVTECASQLSNKPIADPRPAVDIVSDFASGFTTVRLSFPTSRLAIFSSVVTTDRRSGTSRRPGSSRIRKLPCEWP